MCGKSIINFLGMKYMMFLIGAISLFFSCKKDPAPVEEPSEYWGIALATINGKAWAAWPTARLNLIYKNNWLIEIDSYDQFNILREGLTLRKIPFLPGTYPIVNSDSQVNDSLVGADFSYWEGDLGLGLYTVLESDSSSFVTLASYDPVTKELRGIFDITFIVAHRPYAGAPDTLRVRNGVFHTRVRDK